MAAVMWTAMVFGGLGEWVLFVGATPKGTLTDADFKQATWDVVNLDAATSEGKWGVLAGWDVSGVGDFSYAFSVSRNEAGLFQSGGNPNAATFVGVGLESWNTTAITTLEATFSRASSMNADLGTWDVSKVVSLYGTFYDASKFNGKGLDKWNTTAATTLKATFAGARSMNVDVGKWNVAKVVSLSNTFQDAAKFTGEGLDSWITSAVTTLKSTFNGASSMNADLDTWDVKKVKNLVQTFNNTAMFTGKGRDSWITYLDLDW
jgi:hypothetical protein